jgi:hypothetical protein
MFRLSWIAFACMLASCTNASDAPASITPRISWLGPSPGVPNGVETIRVTITGGEMPVVTNYAVSALPDADSDGRAEASVRGLPVDVRLHLRVEGRDANDAVTHVGQADLTLSARERREVELRMAPVAVATSLDGPLATGLAMATVTRLRDGRLLVAGGVQSVATVEEGEFCGGESTGPDLRCFVGAATGRLWVFDPASLRFTALTARLAHPRALHSATLLEDGRVLFAGGASAPVLRFRRQGAGPNEGWQLDFAATSTGYVPVEIFDPLTGEGDAIERGEVTTETAVAAAHLGGAASTIPGDDSSVLLFGGYGDSSTFEMFETRPALRRTTSAIAPPMPLGTEARALVTLGGAAPALFVMRHAAAATSADELVERWELGDGAGEVSPVALTTTDLVPQQLFGEGRSVCSFADGHGVVLGWYGVPCTPGMSTSFFSDEETPYEMCAPALDRNVTLSYDGSTVGAVRTNALAAHAFASSAMLDDGSCAVVGGYGDLNWADQRSIQIVRTARDSAGRAGIDRFGRAGIDRFGRTGWGRGFSAAASLGENGLLIVGGLSLDVDDGTAALTAPAEVVLLPR